jgi:osmotically-inducible protein OsmY
MSRNERDESREPKERERSAHAAHGSGREPYGSPGSGGATYGASGYGAYSGEGQFRGPYGGRNRFGEDEWRGSAHRDERGERHDDERMRRYAPYEQRGYGYNEQHRYETTRRGEGERGGQSYGGYGSTGDYGFGARGEYGESQTGRRLPYGQEHSGSGGYTGYGTYGGRNARNDYVPPGHEQRDSGSRSGSGRSARRGPKGYKRTDERIRDDIYERLVSAEDIDSSDVSLQVSDGKVTLEGTVSKRRDKHAIEDLVVECFGVQDVENRIRVASR